MKSVALRADDAVERRIAPIQAALATARRVAIVRLGSIGDVVETLPFAWILRDLLPTGARLEWIAHSEVAPLLEAVAVLDAVIAIPRTRGFAAIGAWRAAVARRDYDLVIDLHGNLKSGAVARLSRARMRVGFDRADCRESVNALFTTHALPRFSSENKLQRVLELGRWLGRNVATPRFDFEFSGEEVERAQRVVSPARASARPVAILQLGRLGDVRSWPAERYAELARSLREQGRHVVVTGGRADAAAGEELRALLGAAAGAVQFEVATLDLRELGATLQLLARDRGRDHLFVGPDGGGLHLAAACGMRVVGLFGPQDPARTAPTGARVAVLHHREVAPCVPCARRECSNAIPNLCMASITADEVLEQATGRPATAPFQTALPSAATVVVAAARAHGGRLATAAWIVLMSLAPLLFALLRERPGSPLWSSATATAVLVLVASGFAARLGGRRCAFLTGLFLLGMARIARTEVGDPLDLFAAVCVMATLALYYEARAPAGRLGRFGPPLAAAAIAGSVLVAGSDGLLLSLSSIALFELGERTPKRLLEPRFAIPCLLLAPLAIVVRPIWLPEAMLHEHDVTWPECLRFILIGLLPASLAAPFALFHHLKSRRFREDLGLSDRAWRFPKAALLAAAIGLAVAVCRGTAMVLFAPLLALLLAAWFERHWLSLARTRMHIL